MLEFARLPLLRDRVPPRYRPALVFETFYNVGTGAFLSLFLLSTVVLKTVIDGSSTHLAILAALFGGSSLLSPLVSYLGRTVPMRRLVAGPNVVVAALLAATVLAPGNPTAFAVIVGAAFVFRVFPRVAEMNMYRVIYPITHRSTAVGLLKAVAAVSAFAVTLLGYWWFSYRPAQYWLLYWLVAALLVAGACSYARIPVSRRNIFARSDRTAPHRAFWEGCKLFFGDRRFVLYQIGFSLAGFANHMAMVYVAEILTEDALGGRLLERASPALAGTSVYASWRLVNTLVVGLIVAVLPVILMMASAPFWGRFLDRVNPMSARAVFNSIQAAAYSLHAWGALTLQVWPFLAGSCVHAIGNGGGTINWLTGSLYFAPADRISLYNAVHVCLTGLRGMVAPVCGWLLISSTVALPWLGTVAGADLGGGVFWVAAGLSLAGAIVMGLQGLTDPGPRE